MLMRDYGLRSRSSEAAPSDGLHVSSSSHLPLFTATAVLHHTTTTDHDTVYSLLDFVVTQEWVISEIVAKI